ncbi:hypothetical protein RND71_025192 [Anisodus tanguticus]|uniref:Uncharacterized protein n=1 Tax=Anisodus tanguticus TaxID=243964 RepID=A0AAE1RR10_9SOLA|nr:hypothetical protein RND71_025192 [Anisodus tanguticus]
MGSYRGYHRYHAHHHLILPFQDNCDHFLNPLRRPGSDSLLLLGLLSGSPEFDVHLANVVAAMAVEVAATKEAFMVVATAMEEAIMVVAAATEEAVMAVEATEDEVMVVAAMVVGVTEVAVMEAGDHGGGCSYGCCGGYGRGGSCTRCCSTAQESLAYMKKKANSP